jgi:hypothetical protein
MTRSSLLRRVWRASGKRLLDQSHFWLERRRYPDLFLGLMPADEVGLCIEAALVQGVPFCAARMGHVEARLLGEWMFRGGRWSRASCLEAHANAGVFPTSDAGFSAFARIYHQALQHVDLLGFWQSDHQAALVSQLNPIPSLCRLSALEPFRQTQPWSFALQGRSVLVVHPFAASIQAQYERVGSKLFADPRILPLFELQVYRPPLTHAPITDGFQMWTDALYHLQDRVLSMSFDIALLGCGAYGLPLAAAIRQEGRQVIHLGGALQLLFGIRGRRWESDPQIQKLTSADWIRPSGDETPSMAYGIEEGCYW